MKKLSRNQKGFSAVEGLLVILILVVVGAVGYMVYHNGHGVNSTNKTATSTSASSSKPTTTNLYAGWQQLCASDDSICMRYPSNWKLNGSDSAGYTITSPS